MYNPHRGSSRPRGGQRHHNETHSRDIPQEYSKHYSVSSRKDSPSPVSRMNAKRTAYSNNGLFDDNITSHSHYPQANKPHRKPSRPKGGHRVQPSNPPFSTPSHIVHHTSNDPHKYYHRDKYARQDQPRSYSPRPYRYSSQPRNSYDPSSSLCNSPSLRANYSDPRRPISTSPSHDMHPHSRPTSPSPPRASLSSNMYSSSSYLSSFSPSSHPHRSTTPPPTTHLLPTEFPPHYPQPHHLSPSLSPERSLSSVHRVLSSYSAATPIPAHQVHPPHHPLQLPLSHPSQQPYPPYPQHPAQPLHPAQSSLPLPPQQHSGPVSTSAGASVPDWSYSSAVLLAHARAQGEDLLRALNAAALGKKEKKEKKDKKEKKSKKDKMLHAAISTDADVRSHHSHPHSNLHSHSSSNSNSTSISASTSTSTPVHQHSGHGSSDYQHANRSSATDASDHIPHTRTNTNTPAHTNTKVSAVPAHTIIATHAVDDGSDSDLEIVAVHMSKSSVRAHRQAIHDREEIAKDLATRADGEGRGRVAGREGRGTEKTGGCGVKARAGGEANAAKVSVIEGKQSVARRKGTEVAEGLVEVVTYDFIPPLERDSRTCDAEKGVRGVSDGKNKSEKGGKKAETVTVTRKTGSDDVATSAACGKAPHKSKMSAKKIAESKHIKKNSGSMEDASKTADGVRGAPLVDFPRLSEPRVLHPLITPETCSNYELLQYCAYPFSKYHWMGLVAEDNPYGFQGVTLRQWQALTGKKKEQFALACARGRDYDERRRVRVWIQKYRAENEGEEREGGNKGRESELKRGVIGDGGEGGGKTTGKTKATEIRKGKATEQGKGVQGWRGASGGIRASLDGEEEEEENEEEEDYYSDMTEDSDEYVPVEYPRKKKYKPNRGTGGTSTGSEDHKAATDTPESKKSVSLNSYQCSAASRTAPNITAITGIVSSHNSGNDNDSGSGSGSGVSSNGGANTSAGTGTGKPYSERNLFRNPLNPLGFHPKTVVKLVYMSLDERKEHMNLQLQRRGVREGVKCPSIRDDVAVYLAANYRGEKKRKTPT